jgi:hypothetical protein
VVRTRRGTRVQRFSNRTTGHHGKKGTARRADSVLVLSHLAFTPLQLCRRRGPTRTAAPASICRGEYTWIDVSSVKAPLKHRYSTPTPTGLVAPPQFGNWGVMPAGTEDQNVHRYRCQHPQHGRWARRCISAGDHSLSLDARCLALSPHRGSQPRRGFDNPGKQCITAAVRIDVSLVPIGGVGVLPLATISALLASNTHPQTSPPSSLYSVPLLLQLLQEQRYTAGQRLRSHGEV